MRKQYLSLPLVFVLLVSAASNAEAQEMEAQKYVIGVKGMT